LDEKRDDGLVIGFPYFEHEVPLVCDEPGTYVDTDVKFTHTASNSWNHGLGEIVTALLATGMVLTQLVEHDSLPWNALPGQMSSLANGVWRVTDRPARLAHSYTLRACKA
jgi:hypothetical protein